MSPNRRGDFVKDCQSIVLSTISQHLGEQRPAPYQATVPPTQPTCELKREFSTSLKVRLKSKWSRGRVQRNSPATANSVSSTLYFLSGFCLTGCCCQNLTPVVQNCMLRTATPLLKWQSRTNRVSSWKSNGKDGGGDNHTNECFSKSLI